MKLKFYVVNTSSFRPSIEIFPNNFFVDMTKTLKKRRKKRKKERRKRNLKSSEDMETFVHYLALRKLIGFFELPATKGQF